VTANEATRRLGRRPALDGLRALAVLAVVGQHYFGGEFPGGAVGVTVFFVLSGFLITCLLLEEWDRHEAISLRRFWARRGLRLLPALVLLLGVDFVVHLAIDGASGPARGWAATWGPLSYVFNWLLAAGRGGHELTPLWSLSVEEQFYVVWPLLLLGLLALGLRGRRLAVGVTALALVALGWELRWWAAVGGYDRLYYGTDMRAYQLLVGCAAACAWRTGALGRLTSWRGAHAVAWGAAGALTAAAVATRGGQVTSPLGAPLTAAAACVVVACTEASGAMETWLGTGPLAAIGRISYGIYLWNFLFLGITGWALPYRTLDLVLTFLVPVLSFRLVEEPFLRLKARVAPATAAGPGGARQPTSAVAA
jgi:peptidoglycan/LPS O-acetylase OafA/YrhL